MSEKGKHLDELLHFAKNLVEELELKKKEAEQPNQNVDSSPSRPVLSSLREEREKAMRYRRWKQSFCGDDSSRKRLAKSVDRFNEIEAQWNNQKREYQNQANISILSDANVLNENDSPSQKTSPRYAPIRASRWGQKQNSRQNSPGSPNPVLKSSYSRSYSQNVKNNKTPKKENSGKRDVKDFNPRMQRKGSIGGSNKNCSISKINTYQGLYRSRCKNQDRSPESPSQKKAETPTAKSKTTIGDSSPSKKDYLKRKISYSTMRKVSTEAGNPSTGTNFSASTVNSVQQPTEGTPRVEYKSEIVPIIEDAVEGRRGRQASPKRGENLNNTVENPVAPVLTRINLGDKGKSFNEMKDKSSRGQKEGDSPLWSSEKLITSLKTRSKQGDAQKQSNLTNLKNLFPVDSKSSIKTTLGTEGSPVKSTKRFACLQDKSNTSQEIVSEENVATPSRFAKYSILKNQRRLNESKDFTSTSRAYNSSSKVETKKATRSSSCQSKKDEAYDSKNRCQSPSSVSNKAISIQIQEDMKSLGKSVSKDKFNSKDLKLGRENSKEVLNIDSANDLKEEKDKLYKDILEKLHNQKYKNRGKSKQIWI